MKLLLLSLLCLQLAFASEVTYTGAVLEFEPYNTFTEEQGFKVVRENANTIVEYLKQAKEQNADILLTPEYGVASPTINQRHNQTDVYLTYVLYVPHPSQKLAPCDIEDFSNHLEGLHILSCGARKHATYLVADVVELYPCAEPHTTKAPWHYEVTNNCPVEGFIAYNTQVVFDRNGMVVGRYRKQHPYFSEATHLGVADGPANDDDAIFVTDFDVAFTLHVCYDILFEHPSVSNIRNHGIKDVAMSTAWADEAPFDLGDSSQYGWSLGLGVNLLVSGLHIPEKHALGSGIYRAYKNEQTVYTYDPNSGNKLLVASITTVRASSLPQLNNTQEYNTQNTKQNRQQNVDNTKSSSSVITSTYIGNDSRHHATYHQKYDGYTQVNLSSGKDRRFAVVSCNNHFCCHLTYQYNGDLHYSLMVRNGTVDLIHGKKQLGVQQCAIVYCRNSDVSSCGDVEQGKPQDDKFGPFTISAHNFKSDIIYPIQLDRDLLLIGSEIKYEIKNSNYTVKAEKPINNLFSAGLYGRAFALDNY